MAIKKGLFVFMGAIVFLAIVSQTAGAGESSKRSASVATPSQDTHLVSEKALPSGAVKRTWSNGGTFVGNPKAKVIFINDENGNAISALVQVPGPDSPQEAKKMTLRYRESGRSPYEDAATIGASATEVVDRGGNEMAGRGIGRLTRGVRRARINHGTRNQIYDSGCISADTSVSNWRGCYTRKGTSSTDPNAFYLADSSQASGQTTVTSANLKTGFTRHGYASGNQIINWQPGSDVSTGSCYQQTFGINAYGASLSRSIMVCPSIIDVTTTNTYHKADWQGCATPNRTREAVAQTITRVPRGGNATLWYTVGQSWGVGGC